MLKSQLKKLILEILNESTDDEIFWNNVSADSKHQLVVALTEWNNLINKRYTPQLAKGHIYLIKKTIQNINNDKLEAAAKPLAHLPFEMRLSLSEFIEQTSDGDSIEAFYFLLNLSRKFIEPPKKNKADIELRGITQIVSPGKSLRGNVSITGLQDMKPMINFGFGPYSLNDEFYKVYSRPHAMLYLDADQNVKVINMSEVMAKVKQAIDNWTP